jgi:hypothetical protein
MRIVLCTCLVGAAASAAACSGATDRVAVGARAGSDGGLDDPGTFSDEEGGHPACNPSPGSFEVPGNGCDDAGDGQVDNVAECDGALDIDGNAQDFAMALGVCQRAEGGKWGLVSATFTGSYGASTPPNRSQHGILHKFGSVIKPQEGASLGVLSSGWAREFNGPSGSGEFQHGETMSGPGAAPPGFPKPAKGCVIDTSVNDVVTAKITIKTPNNVKGVAFDFNFFSGEWPQWVCTKYNDGFAAMLTSTAFNGGTPDNVSFDAQNNPVSVNNGFFDRCTPGTTTGCAGFPPVTKTSTCPGGETELSGTGFFKRDDYCGKDSTGGGATGWLTSTAPVAPGEEITLEFVIWDTGDSHYDSSVLLDHLRWEVGATQTKTERPK